MCIYVYVCDFDYKWGIAFGYNEIDIFFMKICSRCQTNPNSFSKGKKILEQRGGGGGRRWRGAGNQLEVHIP